MKDDNLPSTYCELLHCGHFTEETLWSKWFPGAPESTWDGARSGRQHLYLQPRCPPCSDVPRTVGALWWAVNSTMPGSSNPLPPPRPALAMVLL